MIEILRVLADGTGTSPRRLAVAPVARSFRYQPVWNSARSHSSSSRFARSRIAWPPLSSLPSPRTSRPARYHGLTAVAGHGTVTEHDGDRAADPRRDDRHGRRDRLDPPRRRAPRPRRPRGRARAVGRAGGQTPERGAPRRPRPGDPAGSRQHAHASLPRAGARNLRASLAPAHPALHGRPGAPAAPGAEAGRGADDGARLSRARYS